MSNLLSQARAILVEHYNARALEQFRVICACEAVECPLQHGCDGNDHMCATCQHPESDHIRSDNDNGSPFEGLEACMGR